MPVNEERERRWMTTASSEAAVNRDRLPRRLVDALPQVPLSDKLAQTFSHRQMRRLGVSLMCECPSRPLQHGC